MQPARPLPRSRRQIGKYRLIASLGQGGMAKVYLALMAGPAGFNKLLVIKALRDDISASGDEYIGMFLDEARLAAQLSHPNVVQTYEVGEADGRYFIAMEYLEGQALRTVQRRLGREEFPVLEEVRVLAEAARGLHYAHELCGFDGDPLKVVHRDVSPQNVFVTYGGLVKVLDFGIAKTGDPQRQTQVGVIKGKADYIAPEQVRGGQIDRRADVFSLGAMLWECLSGERFAGGPQVSDITKIHNRVTGAEAKIAAVAPDAPEALRAICERAIALDPDARYATAEEFAQALDGYLASVPNAPTAKSLGERMRPRFTEEREKLRALVDDQVQLLASFTDPALPGSTGTLPALDHTHARSQSGVNVTGASMLPPLPMPAEALAPSHAPSSAPPPAPAAAAPAGIPKAATFVAVGVAIAGAVLLALQGDEKPNAATTAPPVVPEAVRVAEEPAAEASGRDVEAVRLRVVAEPGVATVLLDGAQLPKLPFEASLEKDGKLHTLEARAEGYQSLRQAVTFDRDQDITLTLSKLPAQPAPSATARRAPRRAPTTRTAPAAAESAAPQAAPATPEPSEPTPAPAPRAEPRKRQQVVAPGQDLLGSTPARTPAAPRIDVEDPYQ